MIVNALHVTSHCRLLIKGSQGLNLIKVCVLNLALGMSHSQLELASSSSLAESRAQQQDRMYGFIFGFFSEEESTNIRYLKNTNPMILQ